MANPHNEVSFDNYWLIVFGDADAEALVGVFELAPQDRAGVSEWVGCAEAAALEAVGKSPVHDLPEAWADHHARAVDAICAVSAR